jgi:hypothetical protein
MAVGDVVYYNTLVSGNTGGQYGLSIDMMRLH